MRHVNPESWRRKRILLLSMLAMVVAVGSFAGASTAKKQDTPFRVVLSGQVNVDPIFGSRAGEWVWGSFLEPLIKVDAHGRLTHGGIVTSWTRVDPRTWRFTVRPGVKFTNGEKGDAYAVANSILLNKYTPGAVLSTYFQNMLYARAKNATTVVLRTILPQYDVPNLMGTVYLMPPKYYKQVGTTGFRAAPIGTGPYMVDTIVPGSSIHIVANPGYWGSKPKTSSIVFTYAPDPSQRLALVQSGAADIAMDLPPAQADAARAAKLKVKAVSSTSKPVLFMRSDKAPTNNIKLRLAISYAIDRNAIVNGIFKNRFKADGYLLNIIPGVKQSSTIDHNLAKAKQLVASLGFKPSVTLNYNTDRSPGGAEVAQAIAQMLGDAGIDVKLDPTTYIASVMKILSGQAPQLFITPAVPNVPDPNFFVQGFLTKASITKNCLDSRFDALGAKALEQPSTQAASKTYDDLNTLAVAKLACFVPLYYETKQFAMRNNVNGFYADPINVVLWQNVTA